MATATVTTSNVTLAARLDRLPPSRYLRGLVARISLGGWFEYYDLFMTAYIALGLIKSGLFTATGFFDWAAFASFVAVMFAGMFVGTLLFSWVSDTYGRKATFTYSLLWYSIATFVMALQNSAFTIDLWRFIASIGIGIQLVTIDTYVSEITPKNARGSYIAFTNVVSYSAVPVVAAIAYLLVPHEYLGLAGWRWVVMIGALGAILIWFIRGDLPESPRWYEIHGQKEKAEAAMVDIEDRVRKETGRELPAPQVFAGESVATKGSWLEIWAPRYLSRTIMLSLFNLFQTIGTYGFAAWVPILLFKEGVTFVHSLEYTFVIAIFNPIGPLIAVYAADRFERKWQIVGLALGIAIFGLIFSQMKVPGLIILCGVLFTLAYTWFTCAFHAYQAELYPTRIRAQGVGFVYSWGRWSAIFVGFVIAGALKQYGTTGVFVLIALAMVAVAVVIGAMGPNSTGERLETLSS
ncbi:MAG TPA: MFS transporter [Candidatus Dormibacteraeota bacterium]|nr:MFS transporter [Candidatus Dormibacteraeota bacterium]